MTLKIENTPENSELVDMGHRAVAQEPTLALKLYSFWDQVTDYFKDYQFEILEPSKGEKLTNVAANIANQIWHNDDFELAEPVEAKYRVKFMGLDAPCVYLNHDDTGYFVSDSGEVFQTKTAFTKSELRKNWPAYERYNAAGLLVFEEVKNDD